MQIYYEDGLKKEAQYVKKILKTLFLVPSQLINKERGDLLWFNSTVVGYEPKICESKEGLILITNKDLFIPKA